MPDGVVQWFDPSSGEGRILHLGRRYVMRAEASEPDARTPGARVHFDIDHDAAGDVAKAASLRAGARVSKRQRRFGDLTGAVRTDSHETASIGPEGPGLGHDLQRHPKAVVERWAQLLAAGDLNDAVRLYSPEAALHTGDEVRVGPDAIRAFLANASVVGRGEEATVDGVDDGFVVRWNDTDRPATVAASRLRVVHGEIVEQWLGELSATTGGEPERIAIELSVAGQVDDASRAYALDKLTKVLDSTGEPVLHASIRLEHAADPARERPALARVTIDVNGEPLRAHVAARRVTEAADLLEIRLKDVLRHHAEHRLERRHRGASSAPGEWRHGDPHDVHPPYFPRASEDRHIVRHKSFTSAEATVDEAIFDMEAMDYDFFLFTDLATGDDALVERLDGAGYRLHSVDEHRADDWPDTVDDLEYVTRPAPVLTLGQAREHLDMGGEARVFFRDQSTERGHVLYRRYDGHYGLIAPAT